MNNSIVITGPFGVGKTTQAKLLGEKLDMPVCVYDAVKDNYRYKIGLSREKALSINADEGIYAMLVYMNEYKSKILQPIIDDHPNHIIDLGAAAHSFDEPEQVERARQAFMEVKDVILLMPSKDLGTSINSLPGIRENFDLNTFLIMHPTNEMFATKTVYTYGKTREEVLSDTLSAINDA
ncbi:MAG: hypothetical protein V3V12_05735 [Gammaproteobacteria bacterium]